MFKTAPVQRDVPLKAYLYYDAQLILFLIHVLFESFAIDRVFKTQE
jgi:hypothetical protein